MGFIQQSAKEMRSWPRNIKLFFLANVLYQFGTGMFSVLYNLYIQGLGYNDSMNGTVVSIQSLATALMFIPIGLIGDREAASGSWSWRVVKRRRTDCASVSGE